MLKSKSFLAIDFGAGTLKLAEFELNEAGGLRLKQYGLKSLGAEGSQETAREHLPSQVAEHFSRERWALRKLERLYPVTGNTHSPNKVYSSMANWADRKPPGWPVPPPTASSGGRTSPCSAVSVCK